MDSLKQALEDCNRTWIGFHGTDKLIDLAAAENNQEVRRLIMVCVDLRRLVNHKIASLQNRLKKAGYSVHTCSGTCTICQVPFEKGTGWNVRDGSNQWGLRHFATFCNECVDSHMKQREQDMKQRRERKKNGTTIESGA